jgi:hypothetical protein
MVGSFPTPVTVSAYSQRHDILDIPLTIVQSQCLACKEERTQSEGIHDQQQPGLKKQTKLWASSTYNPLHLDNARFYAALGSKHWCPKVGIIFPYSPPLIAKATIHLVFGMVVGYSEEKV